MGGSLIEHGGQNPLEAVRFGCRIIHGPNIYNFKEIYAFLKKKSLSKEVSSSSMLEKYLNKYFSTAKNTKKIQTVIKVLGNDILKKTYDEIKKT
jgi:3-deoxy-D-manno-octulosonic-acid transferase